MQINTQGEQPKIVPPISEPLPTKEVNGLTLIWSPDDGRYLLPMPEGSTKYKFAFDEPTGKFIQILINDPDFFYRDRKVTQADGATYQEKIFIGRNPQGEPQELPDPEAQKAINLARSLELKRLFIENLIAAQGAIFLGLMISVGVFFYYLVTGLKVVAESFTTGSLLAVHEVGYYFAWGVGIIGAGFLLKYLVPALLSARKTEYEDTYQAPRATSGAGSDASVNITVTQNSGSGNRAQSFVNDRDL